MTTPVLVLEENTHGRDIIIGDLHGMVPVLRTLLAEIGFDDTVDRLISVGDLIDRGAFNEEAIALLDEDWFYAVRGNHEQFLIDSMTDKGTQQLWFRNGGHWAETVAQEQLQAYADKLDKLPYLIELRSAERLIGVTHADPPPNWSWLQLKSALSNNDPTEQEAKEIDYIKENLLWSRLRINNKIDDPVIGVSRVFIGHTIVSEYSALGNVVYLDTGAFIAQNVTGEPPGAVASPVALTAAIIKDGHAVFHSTASFSTIDIAPYDPEPDNAKMGYTW